MSASAPSTKWKPYPTYKPSGVDWLGDVPSHWETKRLKYIAPASTLRLAEKPDDLPYLGLEHVESWTGRLVSDVSIDNESVESTVTRFKQGDVLFGKLRPYLAKVVTPDFDGCCTSELLVLKPSADVANRYLFYQLLSRDLVRLISSFTYGTKMPRVSPEQIASVGMALPPSDEQLVIAAFLDRETAKIDALVAKKEGLIELLQEKRAALITHAVTKGLNPSTPMKPSSVEWLGDIPAHWEVCRVRDVAASLQTGPFGSQLHSEEYVVGGTPVINPANLRGGRIEADWGCTVDETTRDRLAKHSLSDGDIVFARRGEMGRCGLVTQGEAGWLCGTGSLRVRLKGKIVNSSYVSLVFATSGMREWLQLESVGATMENLNTHIIGRIPMVVPPLSEQGEIGVLVERRVADIDSLASKVQDHIEKLREYRAALISAAVTGKFDVRDEVTA